MVEPECLVTFPRLLQGLSPTYSSIEVREEKREGGREIREEDEEKKGILKNKMRKRGRKSRRRKKRKRRKAEMKKGERTKRKITRKKGRRGK